MNMMNMCNNNSAIQLTFIYIREFMWERRNFIHVTNEEEPSHRSNLHVRKKTHSGEKLENCNECRKVFSRRMPLDEHEYLYWGND